MQSQISNSIPQQQKKQTNKTEQLPLQKPVFIKPYRNNKNKQIRCKIVLLGAPGSGKGTYGQYLKEYFDATVIATGDLVREQVKKKTSIGKLCEDIINKGQLLSDDIVNKIVTEKISYINNDDNYILDGYPRKFSQLIHLYNTTDIISPNVAIYIHVPDEVVITKALGRRICKDCGAGYNINSIYYNNGEYNMPALLPRVSGICDKCKGPLICRSDDTIEVLKERLKVYHETIYQILQFYESHNRLVVWNMKRGIQDISECIRSTDAFMKQLITNL